jgi:ribose 5-phosphate isomerase B
MRIAIVADHNGVDFKTRIVAHLEERGHEVDDRGVHGTETVDYPPLCFDVSREVLEGRADRAIVIGGTGSGEQMACNKIAGIRAALCHRGFIAKISRANNDSNVLVMGAKVVAPDVGEQITSIWLSTAFTGGRHQRRLEQLAALERGEALERTDRPG